MIKGFEKRVERIKLNRKLFVQDLMKSSRALHKELVWPHVEKGFNSDKKEFLDEFDSHEITKEMYAGADHPNMNYSGGPLGGVGNLFSFFGFRDGDDPAAKLRYMLEKGIRLHRNYRVKKTMRGIQYSHRVIMPSKEEIFSKTPLRWTSKSWAKAIETGISGYRYYLRGFRKGSRAGSGFQSKDNIVRSGRFNNVPYLSQLYKQFQKRIEGGTR